METLGRRQTMFSKKKLIPKGQQGLNTEWADNWKFRMTPASKSRVLQGKGVESDKEYTERRKREETKRTWRSDAADIAHGVGEGVLALHPYTAVPYFGAKVGKDILDGNVNWQTALNVSIPLFHFTPTPSANTVINSALEDAAKAGSKTARNWRVAREMDKTFKGPINQHELSNQFIEPYVTNPKGSGKVVHYDNGDGHSLYRGKGATIRNGSLEPGQSTREGQTSNYTWWNTDNPYMGVHKAQEGPLSPSRYIITDETPDMQHPFNIKGPVGQSNGKGRGFIIKSERVTDQPVDLSNASIVQKSPFGWWEIVKSTKEIPENTIAYTWDPTYGYKKFTQEPSTINWKTAQNVKLITDHNQWASQYGYKELPYKLSLSNRRTNKAVRKTIARHNSFYRGINPKMATEQDIQHYTSSLKNGEAPSMEGFIKFAATNPRSEGAGIFVSPFSANSSIYGNGSTNLVRRQYKLGKDRSQWFKQGDFEVQSIYDKQKNFSGSPVINPWEVIRSPFEPKINNGTDMANELILFDKLHYAGPRSYKAKGETTNKTNVTLWHE